METTALPAPRSVGRKDIESGISFGGNVGMMMGEITNHTREELGFAIAERRGEAPKQ